MLILSKIDEVTVYTGERDNERVLCFTDFFQRYSS